MSSFGVSSNGRGFDHGLPGRACGGLLHGPPPSRSEHPPLNTFFLSMGRAAKHFSNKLSNSRNIRTGDRIYKLNTGLRNVFSRMFTLKRYSS